MGGSTLQAAIELAVTAVADCRRSNGGRGDLVMRSGWPVGASRSVKVRDLGSQAGDDLDFPQMALACITQEFGAFTGTIDLTSTLPMAAGLASSAASLVATIAAVTRELDLRLSVQDLCDLAFATEAKWLHTGAGQMDFLACAFGGTRLARFESEREVAATPFPGFRAKLVIGDSGVKAATSRSIAAKRERFESGEARIQEYQRRTDALVARMGQCLSTEANIADVGRYVSACHDAIASLMRTSTPAIDAMVASALSAGGVGAKLTGGGEGGCMFALVDGHETSLVAAAVRALGVTVYETRVSARGLVVEAGDSDGPDVSTAR